MYYKGDVVVELIVFVVVVMVIYFIAKRFTRKEAEQFIEENNEPKEALNIDNVDPVSEVLVKFEFRSKNDQFMINSFPNITINNFDKFKMLEDNLVLKLPASFSCHFGVPYMGREAFKTDETFTLQPGYKYVITFKPKVMVFQKPKVSVEQAGRIE